MRCPRCQGQMNYEWFPSHEGNFWGWRCLFCGEIIDPTVLENRRRSKSSEKSK